MKNKKKLFICIGFFIIAALCNLWTLRPVKVSHVYSDFNSSVFVVVDHLPWADRDKIEWFLSHREAFIKDYPLIDGIHHSYYIMDVGDGFTNNKESPKEDLLCFSMGKDEHNCIVKNYPLVVNERPYENIHFQISSDWSVNEYELTPEGKIEESNAKT